MIPFQSSPGTCCKIKALLVIAIVSVSEAHRIRSDILISKYFKPGSSARNAKSAAHGRHVSGSHSSTGAVEDSKMVGNPVFPMQDKLVHERLVVDRSSKRSDPLNYEPWSMADLSELQQQKVSTGRLIPVAVRTRPRARTIRAVRTGRAPKMGDSQRVKQNSTGSMMLVPPQATRPRMPADPNLAATHGPAMFGSGSTAHTHTHVRTVAGAAAAMGILATAAAAAVAASTPEAFAAPSILTSSIATAAPTIASLFSYSGTVPIWESFALNVFLFGLLQSKLREALTPAGFANALLLGTLLWSTLGWRGWTLCVMYLFLGQAVTKVKFEEKEKKGIAEGRGGRRGPENVWGSAATGLLCAVASVQEGSFLGVSSNVYVLAYVASLATKLADTFASEIGKAYGKTTFLITTFERVEPGTEGAVSAEGTSAAAIGGLLLSLYGYAVHLIDLPGVVLATIAAFLATNAESLIGATLQDKEGLEWMTNEVVNFINTMIGAGIAIAGAQFVLGM